MAPGPAARGPTRRRCVARRISPALRRAHETPEIRLVRPRVARSGARPAGHPARHEHRTLVAWLARAVAVPSRGAGPGPDRRSAGHATTHWLGFRERAP